MGLLQLLRKLTWREALFSLKSFVAAMLALYIAFKLDFDQPAWSVTTVYIVSQQFAGMVLAKSFYRVLGTFIGAAASLVFVALFSNSPELFCLALALWMGLGTTVTLYLRDAPAAYAGMLSGYSAAIIGLPAALAPETAFDFAMARCLEITLGIGCATLMHHVVFPERAGDALKKAFRATLPSFARWSGDALRGEQSETTGLADRRKILSAVVTLDSLRQYAVIDTPELRAIDPTLRQFEGKLLSLLAVLMSVYDRFTLLVQLHPAVASELRPLLERAAEHLAKTAGDEAQEEAGPETPDEVALRKDIESHLPTRRELQAGGSGFLIRAMLLRLQDLLDLWREALQAQASIALRRLVPGQDAAPSFRPYRDITGALLGGMVTTVTVLAASAFWILSAWPTGPLAVTFAGIICAIVAARDDAVAASAAFLKMSIVATVIAFVYVFAILPPIVTFETLVVALAPLYLTCGVLLAIPALVSTTMPVIFVAGGLIALSNTAISDFASFANNAFGYIFGIAMGMAGLNLLRPLRNDLPIRRLINGALHDLAALAEGRLTDRTVFESRMFDRINALFSRLNPTIASERAMIQSGLAGLRLGLNILALRAVVPQTSEAASIVTQALDHLGFYFTQTARGRTVESPSAMLDAASHLVLDIDESSATLHAAEYLSNMATLLRQHPVLFVSNDSADRQTSLHAVPT